MEKNETPKNLALLTADEVTLSILEVDAEGVRIKLWPDVNAVRAHLEECCGRMPGGLNGYSVRHYVCGRYLYCAVALADITYNGDGSVTSLRVRKRDGSVITWQAS